MMDQYLETKNWSTEQGRKNWIRKFWREELTVPVCRSLIRRMVKKVRKMTINGGSQLTNFDKDNL